MDHTGTLFSYDNKFFHGQLRLDVGEIMQVSELSVIRSGEISAHHQICDEITYAISGKAKFISDDFTYDVEAGQIHYIGQNSVHAIQVSPDENFRFLCIGFIPDKTHFAVKAFYDTVSGRPHFVVNDNSTVKRLSEFLIREFYNRDDFSKEMIAQYISQILITVSRILEGKTYDYHNSTGPSASYAMYKILRFIDREYLHITDVKSIAKSLSYSEYYLSHLFKERMGITIKEYLSKKKISYGAELLLTSELSVEKIAEQLGFSSAYSFRRAFKKYTSLSPTEYKLLNDRNFCSPK